MQRLRDDFQEEKMGGNCEMWLVLPIEASWVNGRPHRLRASLQLSLLNTASKRSLSNLCVCFWLCFFTILVSHIVAQLVLHASFRGA